jgi:transcription elongation factor Elf1
VQYTTRFACPDCSQHTFEIEAELKSAQDLANSTCTNCGHELTKEEIAVQMEAVPTVAVQDMVATARQL